jgi:hypothetical protein
MEAPKKIWVDSEKEGAIWPCHNGIEYIRADIVDGLVEALEHYCNVLEKINMTAYRGRAALKALESAEIGRGMG